MGKTALDAKTKNTVPSAAPAAAIGDVGKANRVLFAENLPAEVNENMLGMLFRQYPGFDAARLVEGRGVAFVEFEDDVQAGVAMQGLQGFRITPDMGLKLSYAK